jgi:hypothetical protein
MRKSELSKAVLKELAQAGSLGPQGNHFYEVARLGLAIRSPKSGSFHVLSPRGRFEADRIGREIAGGLGLHVVDYDLGHRGRAASARCACGWSTFRTTAIPSYLLMLTRDAQHHMRHVARVTSSGSIASSFVACAPETLPPGETPAQQRGPHERDHSDGADLPAVRKTDPAIDDRAARHT